MFSIFKKRKIKYDIRNLLHTKNELYEFIKLIGCESISQNEYEVLKMFGENSKNSIIEDFDVYKVISNDIIKNAIKIDNNYFLYKYNRNTPVEDLPCNNSMNIEYNNEIYKIFINPICKKTEYGLCVYISKNKPFICVAGFDDICFILDDLKGASNAIEDGIKQYNEAREKYMYATS